MAQLLFEQNAHRIVWDSEHQELLFEYQDNDSLGAIQWKILRKIYPWYDAPGGKRQNLLYDFFLNLFLEQAQSNPITESRLLEVT